MLNRLTCAHRLEALSLRDIQVPAASGNSGVKKGQLVLVAAIIVLAGLFFYFDLQRFLSLEFFQAQRMAAVGLHEAYPWLTSLGYFAIYVAVTGLSLPGAAVMTLAAGAIFGLGLGAVIVSFASTLGATLAFTFARYLFKDRVQARFAKQLGPINRGVEQEGAFYLFALRLVPAFPFFAINLAMGLTPIKTWTFYWVSQAGMLAGTLVYVNAGRELGQLQSLAGILSPTLILSFALLGLFPLIAKKVINAISKRRDRPPKRV